MYYGKMAMALRAILRSKVSSVVCDVVTPLVFCLHFKLSNCAGCLVSACLSPSCLYQGPVRQGGVLLRAHSSQTVSRAGLLVWGARLSAAPHAAC